MKVKKPEEKPRNNALKYVFLILGVFLLIAGCEHEPGLKKPVVNDPGGTDPDDTSICFERDILPIFITNCARTGGCHDAANQTEGYNLTTYAGITKEGIKPGDPMDSEIYKQLSTGKMSQEPYASTMPQSDKELIRRWIAEGAKDGTNCPTKCDTAVYTYSGAVAPMMKKYCVGCHNATTQSGSTNLSSYDAVKTSALSGKLMPSMKRTSNWMPQGGKKLSDCQINQIQKWIDAGTPNN